MSQLRVYFRRGIRVYHGTKSECARQLEKWRSSYSDYYGSVIRTPKESKIQSV